MFKRIKGYFRKKQNISETNIVSLRLFDSPFPFRGNDLEATFFSMRNQDREKKKRIPVKPIDIIHDLEESVDFPKERIKEAIKELESRMKFLKKTLKTEITDEKRALDMLKARLKYPKYAHLFKWKTTTINHIQTLLDEYELDHKGIRMYVRSIPHDAVSCMQLYAKVLSKVSKEEPNFSLIAPVKYFKDETKKSKQTDPILLAMSPFGNFYYILTAWDKEIGIVSELLDGEELVIDKNGNGKVEKKK